MSSQTQESPTHPRRTGKSLISTILIFVIIAVFYLAFTIFYPYIYSGVLNKNPIPKNSEQLSILGNSDPNQNLNIAVIGDSTALGVGTAGVNESFSYQYLELIKSQYGTANYINYGVNGITSKGLIDNEISKLSNQEFDIVFVSIGANDITAGISENEFKENVRKISQTLASFNIKKVIWMSIPDFITSPVLLPPLTNYLSHQALQFNNITKSVVTENKFDYIDVYDSTRDQFINDKNSFSKDGYHPSKTGYGYWAAAIKTQVRN